MPMASKPKFSNSRHAPSSSSKAMWEANRNCPFSIEYTVSDVLCSLIGMTSLSIATYSPPKTVTRSTKRINLVPLNL
ncbi:hypothetical protein SARC_17594, partial [Sphaeroforma arctica JP610]